MRGNICPATSVASASRQGFRGSGGVSRRISHGCQEDCEEAGQEGDQDREEARRCEGWQGREEARQEDGGEARRGGEEDRQARRSEEARNGQARDRQARCPEARCSQARCKEAGCSTGKSPRPPPPPLPRARTTTSPNSSDSSPALRRRMGHRPHSRAASSIAEAAARRDEVLLTDGRWLMPPVLSCFVRADRTICGVSELASARDQEPRRDPRPAHGAQPRQLHRPLPRDGRWAQVPGCSRSHRRRPLALVEAAFMIGYLVDQPDLRLPR